MVAWRYLPNRESGSDVPKATAAMHGPPPSDAATVAVLSNHIDNASDLEKRLFDEEVAILEAQSTVKTFIDVIANRRVKQRLRER
jgi:hypothetical protein